MKALYPYGQHLVNASVNLTPTGLSGTVYSPVTTQGVSGATSEWTDIYGVSITSADPTVRQVTITDGTLTLRYYVSSEEPISDHALVPFRFGKGLPVMVSAPGASGGISVLVRGISTYT